MNHEYMEIYDPYLCASKFGCMCFLLSLQLVDGRRPGLQEMTAWSRYSLFCFSFWFIVWLVYDLFVFLGRQKLLR